MSKTNTTTRRFQFVLIVARPVHPGLPSTFTGGGVTVWEGTKNVNEVEFKYAMKPGDVCCLDNFVYHQGNPITGGERWAFVIFYRCKRLNGTRWGRVLKQFGQETQAARLAAGAKGGADTGSSTSSAEKLRRFVESISALSVGDDAKSAAEQLKQLKHEATQLLREVQNPSNANDQPAAAAQRSAQPVSRATTAELVSAVQRLAEDILSKLGPCRVDASHCAVLLHYLLRLAHIVLFSFTKYCVWRRAWWRDFA